MIQHLLAFAESCQCECIEHMCVYIYIYLNVYTYINIIYAATLFIYGIYLMFYLASTAGIAVPHHKGRSVPSPDELRAPHCTV